MMNTMSEMWEEYQSKAVPDLASEGQLAATKNAFYAGAYVTMHQLVKNVRNDDSEEVQADRAAGLFAEIEVYLAKAAGMVQ